MMGLLSKGRKSTRRGQGIPVKGGLLGGSLAGENVGKSKTYKGKKLGDNRSQGRGRPRESQITHIGGKHFLTRAPGRG